MSKIFEAAKAENQESLETFNEMDMDHLIGLQGIAQVEHVTNAPENMEQVEQDEETQSDKAT